MFCSNCGQQISEGIRFCSHCGAKQAENSKAVTDPAAKADPLTASASAPKQKKEIKKVTKILVTLGVVLCAFLLGKFVVAPSMVSDPGKDSDTSNQGSQSQQSTENNGGSSAETVNPAYDAIFDDTYIVHFQTFFNMEMKNFALKQNDGIIYCADYGYEDDVVKQWVETMYIPVSEYTDTQKTDLENTMKSQFATLETLSNFTVQRMQAAYLVPVDLLPIATTQVRSHNLMKVLCTWVVL